MEVEDLFTDLADGIKLLKLLEIISSEKLGKPNSGRMRVHKIENVNKSLAFLHTKVRVKEMCDRECDRKRKREREIKAYAFVESASLLRQLRVACCVLCLPHE